MPPASTTAVTRLLLWLVGAAFVLALQLFHCGRLVLLDDRHPRHGVVSSDEEASTALLLQQLRREAGQSSSSSSLPSRSVSAPMLLDDLTSSHSKECGPSPLGGNAEEIKLVYVDNVPLTNEAMAAEISRLSSTSIPPIIHQTSKTRCITPRFAGAVQQWKNYSQFYYYLHDDDAVHRLFEIEFREFPFLEMVVNNCLASGAVLSDLWRYVALYKFGGIYLDIDSVPGPNFDPNTMLEPGVDALFVVEFHSMLSQYFMAVSPRHPIMWYAIQHTLLGLLQTTDTGTVQAPYVTGPHALHRAFRSFVADAATISGGNVVRVPEKTRDNRPVRAGKYVGTHNRSVTAIGTWDKANEFVQREILGREKKKQEYDKMHMQHFSVIEKVPASRSCLKALLDNYWHQGGGSSSIGNTGAPPNV